MAKPRIYVTRRAPDRVLSELRESFDVGYHDSEGPLEREQLLEHVAGVDGCVLTLSDRADDELFGAAGPNLRIAANYAVGFDNLDIQAATKRGVVITNTPDVLTDATAEFAIALMLSMMRRVTEGDRFLRARCSWSWAPTMMLGNTPRGRTLGVVGFGRIGQEVARLGSCLGMRVIFSDPIERDTPGTEQVSLAELLERSDVVSLPCPLRPETHHLIGAQEMRTMKPSAYLINTSRGPVVDEAALEQALRIGEIAGAALDVFENEPNIAADLLELDNVVLAPHLASATHSTARRWACCAFVPCGPCCSRVRFPRTRSMPTPVGLNQLIARVDTRPRRSVRRRHAAAARLVASTAGGPSEAALRERLHLRPRSAKLPLRVSSHFAPAASRPHRDHPKFSPPTAHLWSRPMRKTNAA